MNVEYQLSQKDKDSLPYLGLVATKPVLGGGGGGGGGASDKARLKPVSSATETS